MTEPQSTALWPISHGTAISQEERIRGCLLGTAVGDALLLPYEGLSAKQIARHFPGNLRHRFFCHRGMLSDDTEHTIFIAQSWLRCGGDSGKFLRALAWRLRWWIACLPAGMGSATLRGCIRLWLGISPRRSGVMSAGNGAAMRTAVLGVLLPDDDARRREFVTVATEVTHRDHRALVGALAVAEASAWIVRAQSGEDLWARLHSCAEDDDWTSRLTLVQTALSEGRDMAWLGERLGCTWGITGYVYHTVPVALFVWMRYRTDGEAALTAVAQAGGDTDTIGAIVGALIGCDAGVIGFPQQWIDRIADWPLSINYVKRLSLALVHPSSPPPRWFWPAYPLRSLLFFLLVLSEGFLRIFRR